MVAGSSLRGLRPVPGAPGLDWARMEVFEGWLVFITDQMNYVQFFVPMVAVPSARSVEFADGLDWCPPDAVTTVLAELRREVLN